MTLKATIDKLDDIPEPFRALYSQQGEKFVLTDIEGLVPRAKIDEFRSTNVDLMKKVGELENTLGGLTADEIKALREQKQALADKKLIDEGKLEQLFAQRTTQLVEQHKATLAEKEAALAEAAKRMEAIMIDGGVREAALASGIRPAAVDDVLARARNVFRVRDGKVTPMQGETVLYGKGGDPMTIDEWMGKLSETAPHLFEPSRGSKAGAGQPGHGRGSVISASDHGAFLANLKDIAARKVSATL